MGKKEKQEQNEEKGKSHEPPHFVIAHCNIGINEDLFKTSFASWRDVWLFDIGVACHMTFWRDFFEELNDNVEGAINFVYRSNLKPIGIGSIRFKLPGLLDFLLRDDVLYLHELRRNLLCLVHIQQHGLIIHMFNGKVEIRSSNNMVVMTGWVDKKLLKLKGTSAQARNFAYLSHHDEGTLSSNVLWHARFGHNNYHSLRMMKKKGVSDFPTIPMNLKQCDACILGKHSKQPFHDSNSRVCKKIELIHSDMCGPTPIASVFGNKYIMNFIDDYTKMCWVYLLKRKSQVFETFKNFLGLKMKHNLILAPLCTNNGGEYTSNEFESYIRQHGIKHQTTIQISSRKNE
jgi:hypothetical protein